MIEKFGFHQKPLSDEQWYEVAKEMKNSPHTRLKTVRFIAEAQHQGKRFENMAYLTGGVLFLAFLKFPVIRIQPGFTRIGASAGLAFPFYYYMNSLANKLKLKRIKFAYRKHLVQHGRHPRITM